MKNKKDGKTAKRIKILKQVKKRLKKKVTD
jgi:hypothetical protein